MQHRVSEVHIHTYRNPDSNLVVWDARRRCSCGTVLVVTHHGTERETLDRLAIKVADHVTE